MYDTQDFIKVSASREAPGFIHIAVAKTEPQPQGQIMVSADKFTYVYWHEFDDVARAHALPQERLNPFLEEGSLFEISKAKAQSADETIAFDINPGVVRSSE